MRKDFAKAASKGIVIKNQNFVTARGVYQIVFVRYKNDIYFFKHRNGQLVECCNLSNLGNNQDKDSMRRPLMAPLDIRLDAFYVRKLKTNIKINEAIIKTLQEITSLMECGVISDQEFIDLGKELWMNS